MPSIHSNPSPQDLLLAWTARPSSPSPQEAYIKKKAKFHLIKFMNNMGMLSSRGVRYLLKINFVNFSNIVKDRLQSSSISAVERSQLKDAYEKLSLKKWKVVKKDRAYSNSKFHVGAYHAYKAVMGITGLQPKPEKPVIPFANPEPLQSGSASNPPVVPPTKPSPAPVPVPVPPPLPQTISTDPAPAPTLQPIIPIEPYPAPIHPVPVSVPPPLPQTPPTDPVPAPTPQSIVLDFEEKARQLYIKNIRCKIDSAEQLRKNIETFKREIEKEYAEWAQNLDPKIEPGDAHIRQQILFLTARLHQFKDRGEDFHQQLIDYSSYLVKRIMDSGHLPNRTIINRSLCEVLNLLSGPQAPKPSEPANQFLSDNQFGKEVGAYDAKKDRIVFNGVDYIPVRAGFRGISKNTIAFCSSSPSREIILFNPNKSSVLNMSYWVFGVYLQKARAKGIEDVLNSSQKFFRENMFPFLRSPSMEQLTQAFVDQKAQNKPEICTTHKHEAIPLISLEDFFDKRVGVGPHLALISLYYLDKLANDKSSPLCGGQAVLIRDNLENEAGEVVGAHTWVAFSKDDRLFHIDPMWDYVADLGNPAKLEEAKKLYGARAIENELEHLKRE